MAELRVHFHHVRAAKLVGQGVLCASGVRAWCAANGVDYRRLVREGIPLAEVEHINGAFADRVKAIVTKEAAGDGQG